MPYLIDGHNLIPKVGLDLRSIDDELQLISRLQEYCRLSRKKVEVYFDGAPEGQPVKRRYGMVSAHFIRQGTTADTAIRNRLKKLGNAARNWTVVSSDRQVQAQARTMGAQVLASTDFADLMAETLRGGSPETGADPGKLSEAEVERWLQMFQEKRQKP